MATTGKPSPKPLPDVDIRTQTTLLIHPEQNPTAYIPFQNAETFAFQSAPDADPVSRVNAWWLAEAAWLSYVHSEADIKQIYASRTAMDAALEEEAGTEFTIAFTDRFAIVAFRGTQAGKLDDTLTDFDWIPVEWEGVRVHRGFARAFRRIEQRLERRLAQLKAGCRVWFTGHSLGGALATLAAVHVRDAAGVCTIGSPRVGTEEFAARFNAAFGGRSLRFKNNRDIVTRVPPEGLEPDQFTHVAELRWIDPDGTVVIADPTGPDSVLKIVAEASFVLHWLKNIDARGFPSLPSGLGDHTPLHYVIHVWNDFAAHPEPAVAGV